MFIILGAIVTLPLWLVPFGPIVWIIGLALAITGRSSRKAARVATRIADRQSAERLAILRATNPDAAETIEAAKRTAFKRDTKVFYAKCLVAIVGCVILYSIFHA